MTHEDHHVKDARQNVEVSRLRLEESLELLQNKIDRTWARYHQAVYRAKAPIRIVQRHPFLTFAAIAAVGVILGTQTRSRSRRRRASSLRVVPSTDTESETVSEILKNDPLHGVAV
jgi:ElaB/YqjD/DUF883 family membrane-anchored ribosome-binding protein